MQMESLRRSSHDIIHQGAAEERTAIHRAWHRGDASISVVLGIGAALASILRDIKKDNKIILQSMKLYFRPKRDLKSFQEIGTFHKQ